MSTGAMGSRPTPGQNAMLNKVSVNDYSPVTLCFRFDADIFDNITVFKTLHTDGGFRVLWYGFCIIFGVRNRT